MKTKLYPCARFILLVLLLVGAQTFSTAQQVARTLTAANNQLVGFLEFRPYTYNSSSEKHPLIIFLHGVGERGNGTTDINRVAANAIPKYCANGARMEFTVAGQQSSFVVLSPQLNTQYGAWVNFYVEEMIKYAKANLRIDTNRIYICGLSLGGGGTWRYPTESAAKAKQIAAIVPVCGTGDGTNFCNIAQNRVGVWALHAMDDYTVGVGNTFYAVNQINACNPQIVPRQTIYEFGGHSIWDRAFDMGHSIQNPNVYEWLLTNDRSMPPPVNAPPVAKAGPDKLVVLPAVVTTLDGSQSVDPDGGITSYQWQKISGPGIFVIASPTAATTLITGLGIGTYTFRLTVTDNQGAVSTDDVDINVYPAGAGYNMPPVAEAGQDATITSNNFILNGYGTGDPDGTLTSISWTKVSGPSQYLLQDSIYTTARLNNLVSGTYVFRISVRDNGGLTDSDEMTLTVNLPGNTAPVANAGPNQSVSTSTANLNGSSSYDPNGSITGWLWTKVAGPASYTLSNTSIASPSLSNLTTGTYTFRLQVTDNQGASATDEMDIVVTLPATNQPPIARAGNDQNITVSNTSLNGSSSSDPDGSIATYAWSKIAGPASFSISNTAIAAPNLTALVTGTYWFRLQVADNQGATAADTVIVNVNIPSPNTPPVSVAGSTQNITTTSTSLNGSGSYDPDGSIASYAWSKISGPASFAISNTSIASPSLSALVTGSYSFRLLVTDNQGANASDTVVINVSLPVVNIAPVASAGDNSSITNNSIVLNAWGSYDTDGTINSYLWSKIAGPASFSFNNTGYSTPTVSGLVTGVYQFRLVVTDDQGATGSDTVTITVTLPLPNVAPIANAGGDISIALPANSVSLNGAGSSDPDGSITAYAWTKISGPSSFNIVAPGASATAVNNLVAGVYGFRLLVTDNSGATASDTVYVNVAALPPPPGNLPPVANAGGNIGITLPANSTNLNGTGSTDADGTITGYAWSKISGPASFALGTPAAASTSLSNLSQGVYTFSLTVTDDDGDTDGDTLTVTVYPAPPPVNQSPTANAGTDINITLPVNNTTLNGTASSDPDGNISGYAWNRISGPTQYSIANSSAASTAISNLVEGVYTFRLDVTDNNGATDADTVTITVNAALPPPPPPNQAPVANAGNDVVITLPTSTVTVDGSASADSDGSISGYSWTYVGGPAQYGIVNPAGVITNINNLAQGVYTFQLTVTDNNGATGTDLVSITVNAAPPPPPPPPPPPNVLPVANAGNDVNITLPTSRTRLDGTSSNDPDGSIVTYAWSKTSGPAQYNLSNANSATADVTGLVEGVYVFTLVVTDNSGATAQDAVEITVAARPIIVPMANAGADQEISLPLTTVYLDGTASHDPDGFIADYTWSKVSGPGATTIVNSNSATPTVIGLQEGQYWFELTVTDNSGASSKDRVLIVVTAVKNELPLANAGKDTTIALPANSVLLSALASNDVDGTIVLYKWRQLAGPAVANLGNGSTPVIQVANLQEGDYVFELTVTDNLGGIAKSFVKVSVVNNFRYSQFFKIYPNPASAFINLQYIDDKTGKCKVTIYDAAGKLTLQQEFNKEQTLISRQINITSLKPGMYYLEIQQAGGNKLVRPFVKQ